MQKIAAFIVKKRKLLLVVMLALAVVCAALMPFVGINTDMTKYLPDSSQMKIGMDRMNEAFPNVAETYTIRVMFRGLDARDKLAIREQLAEIPNVDSVAYEPDSDDYNRGDATLYKLTTQYDYKSDEERRSSATWPTALTATMCPCAATTPRHRTSRRSCSSSRSCL